MVVHELFLAVAHRIVWGTLATVDQRGRPRSRVVHPLWEVTPDGRLVGWVTTRAESPKIAHLRGTPFASCSYWDGEHDVAVAECAARTEDDLDEVERVWGLMRSAPPPLGHDPAAIWPAGPGDPGAALLRLDPWRLRAALGRDLAADRAPQTWSAPQ